MTPSPTIQANAQAVIQRSSSTMLRAAAATHDLMRTLHRPHQGHLWACARCSHCAAGDGPQRCQHPSARVFNAAGQPTPEARARTGHCGPEGLHHEYRHQP
jgi:hypothetical protein